MVELDCGGSIEIPCGDGRGAQFDSDRPPTSPLEPTELATFEYMAVKMATWEDAKRMRVLKRVLEDFSSKPNIVEIFQLALKIYIEDEEQYRHLGLNIGDVFILNSEKCSSHFSERCQESAAAGGRGGRGGGGPGANWSLRETILFRVIFRASGRQRVNSEKCSSHFSERCQESAAAGGRGGRGGGGPGANWSLRETILFRGIFRASGRPRVNSEKCRANPFCWPGDRSGPQKQRQAEGVRIRRADPRVLKKKQLENGRHIWE